MAHALPFGFQDLTPRFIINLDPTKLISNPDEFFSDFQKEKERVSKQADLCIQAFHSSPWDGAMKFWSLITRNETTTASKTGIMANLFIAAGVITNSPVIITLSLLGSTAAHIVGVEEAKQKEMMDRMLKEIQKANISLSKTNKALRKEVEALKSLIFEMKKENDKLHESNEELKRSISDLQKMIRSLKDHISSLQQFNSSFRHSLSSLQDSIEHFTSESGKLGTKIESITGLEKSFHQLRDEFSKFSSCFDETKLILTHQNADIMRQLTYLTDLIKVNEERVPQLGKIKELAIIQAQFLLAIQGIKEYQEQLKSTNQELKQAKEKCEQEHQQMETSRKACDAMLVKFEKIFGAERRNQVSLKALQALRARRVDNLEARTLYHIQQENLRRAHK